jgi:hypothetical protein
MLISSWPYFLMSTDCILEAGTKEGFYHVLYNRYSLFPQLQIVAVEAVQWDVFFFLYEQL